MFDNIINLNKYLEPNIRENFALINGGDTTNISDSTKVTKSFENNQKINRSMLVESVTKLMNNVSSNVIQNNSSTAASAAGASNTIWVSDVHCDDVIITGINQDSRAINQTLVKSSQLNMSKISNEISTTIDKTIEKVGSTDLAQLQAENTKQLNDFMSAMPGYDPNKAQKLASQCPSSSGSLLSAGNTCNVNTSYELDASVKQKLELDESFKINDTDNIANDINNKLNQANFASCQSTASASNQLIIQNIICATQNAATKAAKLDEATSTGTPISDAKRGRLEISDIEQTAVAKLYMTCIFDQKNVSEIANKIVNSISKKYNQIYDAVEQKGKDKGQAWKDDKMKLVDLFAAAGAEKIIAAAGNLPTKIPDTSSTKNNTEKSDKSGDNSTSDKLPTIIPDNTLEQNPPGSASGPTSGPASGPASEPTSGPTSGPASEPTSGPASGPTSGPASGPASELTSGPTSGTGAGAASGAASDAASGSDDQSLLTNPWITYGSIILVVIIISIIIILITNSNSRK